MQAWAGALGRQTRVQHPSDSPTPGSDRRHAFLPPLPTFLACHFETVARIVCVDNGQQAGLLRYRISIICWGEITSCVALAP
jgi:hypothetical protein